MISCRIKRKAVITFCILLIHLIKSGKLGALKKAAKDTEMIRSTMSPRLSDL